MTGGLVFYVCWLGEPFRGAGAPSPRTPRARRVICGGVGNAALETPLGPIQSPARRNPSSLLDLSPSAAMNPSPFSYDPAVAALAPSDLPRQPPPLWLLRPPTLSTQFILHTFLLEVLIGPGREEAA